MIFAGGGLIISGWAEGGGLSMTAGRIEMKLRRGLTRGGRYKLINKQTILRKALSMSLVMLVSELIAYFGDLAFAFYYGTSAASDAYIAAGGIIMMPGMLFGACISSTFIPLYISRERACQDRFANTVLTVFTLVSAGICLLMLVWTRPVLKFLNPGFDAERLALAVGLARISLFSLLFLPVSMVLSTLLQAHNRFLYGPASMLPRSVCMIFSCLLFARRYGIYAVAYGALLANMVQTVILAIPARKVLAYRWSLQWKEESFQKMLRLSLPPLMGMAVRNLALMIRRAMSSGFNVGDMTAMHCSFQMINLLSVVLVVPLNTVIFTNLSRFAAEKNGGQIYRIIRKYTKIFCALLLPVVVLGMVFHREVIFLAYGRGQFDQNSVLVTAGIFLFQLPGLIFSGLDSLYANAFHACQNTRTPLYAGIIASFIQIALFPVFSPWLGISGLALAATLSELASMLMLGYMLAAGYKRFCDQNLGSPGSEYASGENGTAWVR